MKHLIRITGIATACALALAVLCIPPHVAKAFIVDPNRQEISGDPGSTITGQFNMVNTTGAPVTFYISIENFEAEGETGNPKFVDTQENLAVWTTFPASVPAAAHAIVTVPFKVAVPKNAEPGGYSAAIFATTVPPSANGGTVSVGSREGMLLLFDVNGAVSEGVTLLEFGTDGRHRIYSMLPIQYYYRFQNSGNDRIKPLGDVIIKDMIGHVSKDLNANRVDGNVLPRSIRRFETPWVRNGGDVHESEELPVAQHYTFFGAAEAELTNYAFGFYTAHLILAYGNVTQLSAAASYTIFVFPWQLTVIVIIIGIILWFLLRGMLRRYNRHILNQASRNK